MNQNTLSREREREREREKERATHPATKKRAVKYKRSPLAALASDLRESERKSTLKTLA
jgi:hypothetical protein